jgi:hypothetical protein
MSSGFITEAEAAETRQKRQEEWERVRKPEDPLGVYNSNLPSVLCRIFFF